MPLRHPAISRSRGGAGKTQRARQRIGLSADPLSRLLAIALLAVSLPGFHERNRPLDGGVYTEIAGIEQVGIVGLP